MKKEDFYKLHIGQEIYLDGEKKIVDGIYRSCVSSKTIFINLSGEPTFDFDYIYERLSFEPPKQKKKVKLYRYTFQFATAAYHSLLEENDTENIIEQTAWKSFVWKHNVLYKLLKTEEKEIEIEE